MTRDERMLMLLDDIRVELTRLNENLERMESDRQEVTYARND